MRRAITLLLALLLAMTMPGYSAAAEEAPAATEEHSGGSQKKSASEEKDSSSEKKETSGDKDSSSEKKETSGEKDSSTEKKETSGDKDSASDKQEASGDKESSSDRQEGSGDKDGTSDKQEAAGEGSGSGSEPQQPAGEQSGEAGTSTQAPKETPEPVETPEPETGTPGSTETPAPEQTPEGEPAGEEMTPEPTETPEPTPTPIPIDPIGKKAFIGSSEVTVRSEPSKKASSVGTLKRRDKVFVVGSCLKGKWLLIEGGGCRGYVQSKAVTDEDPGDGTGLILTGRTPSSEWKGKPADSEEGLQIPILYQGDYRTVLCTYDGFDKSVASSGCGATSVSMVVAYLTGNTEQTPEILFDYALRNGMYHGDGLSHSALKKLASHWGVSGHWVKGSEEKLTRALEDGKPVIAHMGAGIFTEGGHYIVLRGVTEEGRVLVNDPNSRSHSHSDYSWDTILGQTKGTDAPFMICG